jgi:hypothetical protein
MLLQATHLIEADLSGAASPNPMVVAAWRDVDNDGDKTGRAYSTVLADTTDVTVINVAGSQSGDGEVAYREIEYLGIHNADNASVTVNIWLDDGTNERTLFKATLATLETAVYTPARGWHVLTTAGALKQVGQVTSASLTAGTLWVGNSSNVAEELDGGATGGFFVSDGTDIVRVASSGDVAVSGAGAFTIQPTAVEASMLQSNLQVGNIPLNITDLRIIAGDVIGNTTEGMLLDGNTDPVLARTNGATDKSLRVHWAANSVIEVQFPPVAVPQDYDNTADTLAIHCIWAKDGNTDTAMVVDVQAFSGIGDTEMGGNTAAINVAANTAFETSVALTGANVGANPGMLNISMIPGAHANDALYLMAAWIQYPRRS